MIADPEAEAALLGAMMLDASVIPLVIDRLEAEDFTLPANRRVFEAIASLWIAGSAVDAVTVSAKNGGHDSLVIVDMVRDCPSAASARHYADIVADRALRRRIAAAGRQIAKLAEADEEPLDAAHATLAEVTAEEDGDESIHAVMDRAIERIESGGGWIPTGYIDIDRLTGGIEQDSLVVVGARPSVGKSALAAGLAVQMAERMPVLFVSLEMSAESLSMRMACARARVDLSRARDGKCTIEDWNRLVAASAAIAELPIEMRTANSATLAGIRARVQRSSAGLVIVDYLQLMSHKAENRQQEIAAISRGLKTLARERKTPFVVLSQLNRKPMSRADSRPQLSDLRESGAIEQDADQVWFLHRPDDGNETELIVAKNRNGPTGSIKLTFRPEFAEFVSHAPVRGVA